MRKPNIASLASTFVLALFVSGQAKAGHESNGGNYVKSNFISWARVIYSYIADMPENTAILSRQQTAAFGAAISTTDVKPIQTDEPFTDNLGNPVHARVVNDTDRPGFKRIELEQRFWTSASPRDPGVCRLVLHEYLRVIGVDDEIDEDRNAVSYRWNDVCDWYIGNGTFNMDFEVEAARLTIPRNWWSIGHGGYQSFSDDTQSFRDDWSVHIAPTPQAADNDFGGVAQCTDAAPFRQRHFRLTGLLKLMAVMEGYAGLWARIDDAQGNVLLLDNMRDRGLGGTRDWTPAIIEFPVTHAAHRICFGALLVGNGVLWADHLQVVAD